MIVILCGSLAAIAYGASRSSVDPTAHTGLLIAAAVLGAVAVLRFLRRVG